MLRKKPSNPKIRIYVKAVQEGQKFIHVLPILNGWKVQKIGNSSQAIRFRDKELAIAKAVSLAREYGSKVIVHGENGFIEYI